MEQRAKDLGELEPPPHDRIGFLRVHFLIRVESLINVGCKFRPDDFPAHVWDELIALALERAFVDRLVDQQRRRSQEQEHQLSRARAATGVPPPGGTIFKTTHPFR